MTSADRVVPTRLRTFRLRQSVLDALQAFLEKHPEVGSLNHLVDVALEEFATTHKEDKSWLKTPPKIMTASQKSRG